MAEELETQLMKSDPGPFWKIVVKVTVGVLGSFALGFGLVYLAVYGVPL